MIRLRLLGTVELRDDAGLEVRRVLAQPKRLALLAFLALAAGRSVRRDIILARFWPELDTARGRAALRQALHHLRRELGADVIVARTAEELGIHPELVWCDVVAFQDCVRLGDDVGADALYRGDLLEGVFVADAAPEWEDWLDRERTRLRDAATAAATRQGERAEQEGRADEARNWASRAFELSGGSEAAFRTLLRRTAATGDLLAVRRAYDAFVRRQARDFEAAPEAETKALADRLLGAVEPAAVPEEPEEMDPPVVPEPGDVAPPAPPVTATRSAPARPRRLWRWAAAAAGVLAAIGAAAIIGLKARPRTGSAPVPVLAVGSIRDLAESPNVAAALSELLTTELVRAGGARVVGTPRLYEVAAQLDTGVTADARLSQAAHAAGADVFLEGALYRAGDGLRLDLRRIELATGRVLGVYSVVADDAYALTEQATARVLADLGLAPAAGRLADVTARSVVALRFYQEGLRARTQADDRAARRFFHAALAEDSTFAMASFELSLIEDQNWDLMRRTLRLAERTTEREALIVRAHLAHAMDAPEQLAVSESLTVRFPQEPAGHLIYGRALVAEGRFHDAVPAFRRVIQLDSLSMLGERQACRACEAYSELSGAYVLLDSIPAALRISRRFARRAPHRHDSWAALATAAMAGFRWSEALAAMDSADATGRFPLGELDGRMQVFLRQGRPDLAEAAIQHALTAGPDPDNARWVHLAFLHHTGRYSEALALANELIPAQPSPERYWASGRVSAVLAGMGRYREAGALRDSAARNPWGPTATRQVRSMMGELTYLATAMHLAGDSAAVRQIADSLQQLLPRSGRERDRRLYSYARGMQYQMQGRREAAVRELERAMYSPLGGYARINIALAEELLHAGDPQRAAYYAEAAIRGPLTTSLGSLPLPEMQLTLARALDAAGRHQEALVQYERVLRAWSRADAVLKPRRDYAAARAAALRTRLTGTG